MHPQLLYASVTAMDVDRCIRLSVIWQGWVITRIDFLKAGSGDGAEPL